LTAVVRLTIAYDGTPFAGWAVQPKLRTVQSEIEAALERILGESVSLSVAGRTDAGVHAWGQVASFELEATPPGELVHRLNGVLPREISMIESAAAPEGFDARRDARSRTYCYRVLASQVRHPFEIRRALWWPHAIEQTLLDRCAAALVGRRDFTAFTPTQTGHTRFEREVINAGWRTRGFAEPFPGEVLEFWIEADAFMRHMVRVLVGTMLDVAGGRRSADDFEELLRGAPRERAGETAPPHGLYLASVRY
jgi:tRNA pseudouridine38-40 synthase